MKALPTAPALTYAQVPGSIPNQLHRKNKYVRKKCRKSLILPSASSKIYYNLRCNTNSISKTNNMMSSLIQIISKTTTQQDFAHLILIKTSLLK